MDPEESAKPEMEVTVIGPAGVPLAARCKACDWQITLPTDITYTQEEALDQVKQGWNEHLAEHHPSPARKKPPKDDLIDPSGGCAR